MKNRTLPFALLLLSTSLFGMDEKKEAKVIYSTDSSNDSKAMQIESSQENEHQRYTIGIGTSSETSTLKGEVHYSLSPGGIDNKTYFDFIANMGASDRNIETGLSLWNKSSRKNQHYTSKYRAYIGQQNTVGKEGEVLLRTCYAGVGAEEAVRFTNEISGFIGASLEYHGCANYRTTTGRITSDVENGTRFEVSAGARYDFDKYYVDMSAAFHTNEYGKSNEIVHTDTHKDFGVEYRTSVGVKY